MDKVLAKNGARHNMETLFNDLQTYTEDTFKQLLSGLVDSLGIIANTSVSGVIDPSDTSLKVTAGSTGYVTVGAGKAVSSGLQLMEVISPQSVALPADGTHNLFIQPATQLTGYTAVQNGFKYTAGENLTATRELDSYNFAWDTTVSGLVLANVVVSGNTAVTITDRRGENLFIVRQHQYSTLPLPPMVPKNIRIADVYSPTTTTAMDPAQQWNLTEAVRTGLISHEAAISIKWNYDDIQGQGGKGSGGSTATGKFRISNSGGNKIWAANELAGYYLYLSFAGKDYYIVSNTATYQTETILTVVPIGNNTTIVDGINATGAAPASIHSGCDFYEIKVVPVLKTMELLMAERYEDRTLIQNGIPTLQCTMDIFLGEKVLVFVRAVTGTLCSDYVGMLAGSYTKLPPYDTVQHYDVPFLIKLPGINSVGVKVGANQTSSGFIVTIAGWNLATDYEICYTTDAAGPDFANPTHAKITTRQTSIDITTSGSRTYYIAVRPLMSGQAVAEPKTCSVVSGSGEIGRAHV
jgi:hypothetical protein